MKASPEQVSDIRAAFRAGANLDAVTRSYPDLTVEEVRYVLRACTTREDRAARDASKVTKYREKTPAYLAARNHVRLGRTSEVLRNLTNSELLWLIDETKPGSSVAETIAGHIRAAYATSDRAQRRR